MLTNVSKLFQYLFTTVKKRGLFILDQPIVTKLKKIRVNVGDFEQKKVIGRGHFGEVILVKEKQTGDVYAMKVMKKSATLAKQNVSQLLLTSVCAANQYKCQSMVSDRFL